MIGIICLVFFVIGMIIIACVFLIPSKEEIPPIAYAVKHSKTVWGLWFTGDRHYKLIDRYNSIKKILLMKPDSPAFLSSTDVQQKSRDEIIRLTKRAILKGIEIRWYSEPQEYSVTIYDQEQNVEPSSNKAYYITSILEGGVPRKDRTLHILKKTQDEGDFNVQINRFKKLWDSSSKPKPEEYDG